MSTTKTGIARIRESLEQSSLSAIDVVTKAMGARKSTEEVEADALLPLSEAPIYLQIAMRMAHGTLHELARQDEARPTQQLNVMVVAQAQTTADWLAGVAAFKQDQLTEVKPVLDIEPVVVAEAEPAK